MRILGKQYGRGAGRWAIGLGVLALIVAIFAPVFFPAKSGRGTTCMGNLRQLRQALLMYSDDQGAIPPASMWMDSLASYVRLEKAFHCPAAAQTNPYVYGYAMRTLLAGKDLRRLKKPEEEPLVFDSFPIGRNAHTNLTILPGFSRHGGQNIVYADGHVRFFRSSGSAQASGDSNG